VVHTPSKTSQKCRSSPPGVTGTIELRLELVPGLRDPEGFSHLWVIHHCHRSGPQRLTVTPFLEHRPHDVLATRRLVRPNPIGLSLAELLGIDGSRLLISGVDILDGPPSSIASPMFQPSTRPPRSG